MNDWICLWIIIIFVSLSMGCDKGADKKDKPFRMPKLESLWTAPGITREIDLRFIDEGTVYFDVKDSYCIYDAVATHTDELNGELTLSNAYTIGGPDCLLYEGTYRFERIDYNLMLCSQANFCYLYDFVPMKELE